ELRSSSYTYDKPVLSNADQQAAAAAERDLNRKLRKVDQIMKTNMFTMEGTIVRKTEQQGTGLYWNFDLRTDDGITYPFMCGALSSLYFRINQTDLDDWEGYQKLGTTYKKATLYIPNSAYEYITERCRNKGCDGTSCPSVIVMQSSLPVVPSAPSSNDARIRTEAQLPTPNLSIREAESVRERLELIKRWEADAKAVGLDGACRHLFRKSKNYADIPCIYVEEPPYWIGERTMAITFWITNASNAPINIAEVDSRGYRFLNPIVLEDASGYPKSMLAENGLRVEDNRPIAPGETRKIKILVTDTKWETKKLSSLFYGQDNRFTGQLNFVNNVGNVYIVNMGKT
ncbi:MAG: methane monooxygenase/ammonia monooxygenase subunit B, partial [Methylococcales bacterium]